MTGETLRTLAAATISTATYAGAGLWLGWRGVLVALAATMLVGVNRALLYPPPTTARVLEAMGEAGRRWHVLDLSAALDRSYRYAPRVHALLARLERDGVVDSGWDDTTPRPRRMYWLADGQHSSQRGQHRQRGGAE